MLSQFISDTGIDHKLLPLPDIVEIDLVAVDGIDPKIQRTGRLNTESGFQLADIELVPQHGAFTEPSVNGEPGLAGPIVIHGEFQELVDQVVIKIPFVFKRREQVDLGKPVPGITVPEKHHSTPYMAVPHLWEEAHVGAESRGCLLVSGVINKFRTGVPEKEFHGGTGNFIRGLTEFRSHGPGVAGL